MNFFGRYIVPEFFRRVHSALDLGCDRFFDRFEAFNLPIEVPGQQLDGVLKFSPAFLDLPVFEVADHEACASDDSQDQRCTAGDDPKDRPRSSQQSTTSSARKVSQSRTLLGIVQSSVCPGHFTSPKGEVYRTAMEPRLKKWVSKRLTDRPP